MGRFKGKGRGPGAVAPKPEVFRLAGLEFLGAEIPQVRHAA